jgi:hypothetical protein
MQKVLVFFDISALFQCCFGLLLQIGPNHVNLKLFTLKRQFVMESITNSRLSILYIFLRDFF